MARIRSKYERLAASARFHDAYLDVKHGPESVLWYFESFYKKRKVKLVHKSKGTGRLSRMTTTWGRKVYLGWRYRESSDFVKAIVLAHEAVHVLQQRHYRLSVFGLRYALSKQFRWAMEVQGYAQSLKARKAMGGKSTLTRYVDQYANSIANSYSLRGLKDRTKKARKILEEAIS